MRRLLLFAYDYPPSLVGVRRTVKFIKYLRDFGWQCGVITVRPVCASGWDDAPLREIAPARPAVWRTGSLDPYRLCVKARNLAWPLMRRAYHGPAGGGGGSSIPKSTGGWRAGVMRWLRRGVFLPDDRMGWLPFALAAGLSAALRWKPDALYSTSYPHTAHLAAGGVRVLTGIPWLADFRDGWTQNPAFFDPLTPLHAAAHRRLERWVARRADRVVTVSPPITRHLQALRAAGRAPVETIYNGFDEECVGGTRETRCSDSGGRAPPRGGPGQAPAGGSDTNNEFRMLYTGTFFASRRPDTLFRAAASVAGRRPDFRRRARLILHTALEPRWVAMLGELGLESLAEVRPVVAYREALALQRQADALVLVVDAGPGSEIFVTQKVFEYLASGRPILALAPDGACREVLEETGGATIARPDDVDSAARALEGLFDAWLRGEAHGASPDRIARFHRREQTRRLAQILATMDS